MVFLKAYAILVFVFILSGIDIWLARTGVHSIPAWITTFAVALPLFVASACTREVQHRCRLILKDRYNSLIIFTILSLYLFCWAMIPFRSGLQVKIIGALSLYGIFIAWLGATGSFVLGPRALKTSILLSLIVVALSVVIDFLKPGTFSEKMFRSGGLLENPNASSGRILMLILISSIGNKFTRIQLLVCAFGLIAMLLTQSRGSLVALVLIAVTSLVLSKRFRLSIFSKTNFVTNLVTIIVALAALGYAGSKVLNSDAWQHRSMQKRMESLSNPSIGFTEDERYQLLIQYTNVALKRPLLGYGAGFSQANPDRKPPHNLYLRFWVDYGMIGLCGLLLLVAATILNGYKASNYPVFSFWFSFALLAFFSHTIFDARGFLLCVGIAAALGSWSNIYQHRPHQSRLNYSRRAYPRQPLPPAKKPILT